MGANNISSLIKSCGYLINTSKKITDIAALCGFNNISYYNRDFIRIIKISPAAYRKAMQQANAVIAATKVTPKSEFDN
ncbi:helix-turn-helix domain-containing protein [Anaerocolumna jejuensis]|uniref:helix-turn-helix domain-containing protein n=1 Tax=Anaerocolumna jejuensis TaxID=259063 RepID=UPI003F7C60FB